MPFSRVDPGDAAAVAASVDILNAAMEVDDPTSAREIPELAARELRFGWDLEPKERYLYVPPGGATAVGVLDVELPRRDNRHLVWAELTVHPEVRRRGHGTALMHEVLRLATEAGRTTIWVGASEEDLGARAFTERFGFRYASHDARRRQVLAQVDPAAVERLHAEAGVAARDYVVQRLTPPVPDRVLTELVEVTAAINDAPMGELTYEAEHFDLARLQDHQTARAGVGDHLYRVVARHRVTGRVGGHTVVVANPRRPKWGVQGDTAVAREHRGHRLGLLVKIEMMRWLAEVEPQLETIETWNHADNAYMINVNEALGYRLSRIYDVYELSLAASTNSVAPSRQAVTATV